MTISTPVKEEKKQTTALAPRRANPLYSLQEEMNRLFEDFTRGFHKPLWMEPVSDFNARVDMKDSEKNVVVTAELPGVELKDIEVSLEDNSLVIRGEKRSEKEEKDKNFYRMERSYGSFYRVLPMPCAIEKDAIEASYKDGVLKVTLTKSKEAVSNGTKIQIKAG
ncbi:MAG: Hsp20/alpha crystallin family protein [Candidatus Melainabacteria bacterium]|nr:Hsp20/alpha crystallin family protein [Candidatus Melainabacteria bacterium]